jgi:hypothetical protein
MMKERIAAIVIGMIMIFSVVGFAMSSVMFRGGLEESDRIVIPNIVDRKLTSEEMAYVLGTGRVLIEDIYYSDCSECKLNTNILEAFAKKYSSFIVLETVVLDPTNESGPTYEKFQFIGRQGSITELEDQSLEEENLTELFCDIAISQPKECLLKTV